jgi:hypothetical protein
MRLSQKILVLFLCMVSAGNVLAAEFSYENPSKCVILAKTLNVTVAATSVSQCSVTVPAELESFVSVSEAHGQVVVRQTAVCECKTPVKVFLPRTTKLSCWLTLRANIEVFNEEGDKLAPLDLNLFNGGVATINNGTYASSSINMQGLGFIDLNFVERGKPSSTLMDGITTLATKSASKGFSMSGGGMSLGNGARMGFMSAGSRPQQLPVFDDISLDDLFAYSVGSKKHPALPNGWSNKFPGASFSAPYDDTLKELIKNLSLQPVADTAARTQVAPQAEPLEVPPALAKVLNQLESRDSSQAVATKSVASSFSEADKAESLRMFGRNVYGLSFGEVKAILLSDEIYKSRIPEYALKANGVFSKYHPYCLDALAYSISLSTATEEEKHQLWALFLYRELSFTGIKFNDVTGRVENVKLQTPKTLCDALIKQPKIEKKDILSKNLVPFVVAGVSVGGTSIGIILKDRAIRDRIKSFFKNKFVAASLSASCIAGLVYWLVSKKTQKQPSVDVEVLEGMLDRYFEIVKVFKVSSSKKLPADLAASAAQLKEELATINYKTAGRVDNEKLAEYLSVLLDFYSDLGKEAGITT